MKKTLTCFLILMVVLLGSLTFAFQNTRKNTRAAADLRQDAVESAVPVTVSPVILNDFEERITAVGTLKARETVVLSPKVAGSVEAVLVDIGQPVIKDQILIRINSTHFDIAVDQANAAFAGAKAMVSQAKIQFEHAQKQYVRATRLMADKAISQVRFEEAEAAFKAAKEQFLGAEEESNRAMSAIRTAQQFRMDAVIRSPISGVVVERNVEIGQAAAPGAPLLRILDQSALQVDIQLPESDFGKITPGMSAVIEMDAFKNSQFQGKVALVNPMIDMQTRTFRARVEVGNPEGTLVEGMFARVALSVGKRRSPAVPRDALAFVPGSNTCHVFLVRNGVAVKQIVVPGANDGVYAEICENLAENEIVVVSGKDRLRSGVPVTVH
jgi:RND family efflux transporter MFP subunit